MQVGSVLFPLVSAKDAGVWLPAAVAAGSGADLGFRQTHRRETGSALLPPSLRFGFAREQALDLGVDFIHDVLAPFSLVEHCRSVDVDPPLDVDVGVWAATIPGDQAL